MLFDSVLRIISSHLYASNLMFLTVNCFDTDSTLRKPPVVAMSLCKFTSLKYRTKLIYFLKNLPTFNYAFVKRRTLHSQNASSSRLSTESFAVLCTINYLEK
jgi:hypothetical protein